MYVNTNQRWIMDIEYFPLYYYSIVGPAQKLSISHSQFRIKKYLNKWSELYAIRLVRRQARRSGNCLMFLPGLKASQFRQRWHTVGPTRKDAELRPWLLLKVFIITQCLHGGKWKANTFITRTQTLQQAAGRWQQLSPAGRGRYWLCFYAGNSAEKKMDCVYTAMNIEVINQREKDRQQQRCACSHLLF